MSIATGRGDDGTCQLMYGPRVSKAAPRVEAYGTIDELGAQLGLARAFCDEPALRDELETLQRELFLVGAELATPPAERHRLRGRLEATHPARLKQRIAEIEATPGLLNDWALPGATPTGSFLDVARTVCRRAERCVVGLVEAGEEDHPQLIPYLNALSDLLWLLARQFELQLGEQAALHPERKRRWRQPGVEGEE